MALRINEFQSSFHIGQSDTALFFMRWMCRFLLCIGQAIFQSKEKLTLFIKLKFDINKHPIFYNTTVLDWIFYKGNKNKGGDLRKIWLFTRIVELDNSPGSSQSL